MKVLITAGPTSVAIDDVRVITNLSSGRLGRDLFEELTRQGLKVDLWLSELVCWDAGLAKRFLFYEDLEELIRNCRDRYDWILHCAAVSDFGVERVKGKIASDKDVVLRLFRLNKLWPGLLRLTERLVLFKLEPDLRLAECKGRELLKEDERIKMVVANSGLRLDYRAKILMREEVIGPVYSRKDLARKLGEILLKSERI